jgi:AcrR family transcriptional regulator
MTERSSILSTADARRPLVVAAAVREFARGGLHGATVADVARAAKISPAYVFKLYPRKEQLFAVTLGACFDHVLEALEAGADAATSRSPEAILDAMGDAYAHLIADRSLLMLQVHAQSAADVPEIGDALRSGLERVTVFAKTRSGAPDDAVQRFIAYGQLCHLIVTTRVEQLPDDWARLVSDGITHPA